jgi:hypothetical protein
MPKLRSRDARVDRRRRRGAPHELVLHDDAEREYAYVPANGLPDTKVGTFSRGLMDEAKKRGWTIISMNNDWKTIFPEGDR